MIYFLLSICPSLSLHSLPQVALCRSFHQATWRDHSMPLYISQRWSFPKQTSKWTLWHEHGSKINVFMYIHSIFLTLYLRIRHELSFIRSFQHFFNAMCKQSHIVWEILSHGWQHLQAYEGLLFFAPCAPCARSAVSSSRMVFKVVSSNGLPLAASWNFTSRRMSKASYEISTSRLFLRSLWHSHWLSGTCWGTGQ